ncbi:MAG: UDP-N-acetylmuramoyl-tripeptide--D-alanyl-D-alanine ligase [bacterium]
MKSFFKKIIVSIITLEAKLVLNKYKPKIIAVTGSVGKTSTKDAIFTIMNDFFKVRRSEKSFNSEIGLPLTILGLKNAWNNPFLWFVNIINGALLIIFKSDFPEWLILEVGADKPGDIESVSRWLKTDIVVMTRIAEIPVHIEQFKGQKEIVKEKAFLIKTLKENGTLILNFDDQSIEKLKDKFKGKILSFGFEKNSKIIASNYHISYEGAGDNIMPKGIAFKIDYNGNNLPVRLSNVFGKQNVYTALAAFSVGLACNLNFVEIINVLKEHSGPPGRFKPLHGINDSLIIDDTYNSSPVALEMALQSFSEIKNRGRKIAILGDMLELGEHSEKAHKKIGKMIPETCGVLIVVGEKAKLFADGALSAGMKYEHIHYFKDSVLAGEFAKKFIEKGDAVLIKGSQGIRMEKVVADIVTEQERLDNKLVRQEAEWIKR